jgi:non-specific serine/threonine protein kinase
METWPSLRVTPAGALRLVSAGDRSVFERGLGEGLLALATTHLKEALPPELTFWRELIKRLLTRLCTTPDLEAKFPDVEAAPAPGELASLVLQAPPMPGGEYLEPATLEGAWTAARTALESEALEAGGIGAFLREKAPLWNLVGRVCFHLAENKRDPERPFAFLATFAHRVAAHGAVQHIPLRKALDLYSAARDRPALLKLLEPLQRAGEADPFLGQLVASGGVYEALAWSPHEAYSFLRAVPGAESAGVSVRLPDWWQKRPRPRVVASVGKKKPGTLGASALLDFSVGVALDGEDLRPDEVNKLLRSTEGLVLLRGRWVEVDPARLAQALKRWKEAEREAKSGEMTILDGMRLLAGVPTEDEIELAPEEKDWSTVVAGDWLAGTLARLRDPSSAEGGLPRGLKATLRPYQEVGVRWLRLLTSLGLGACLADDMGLGKTVQVIGLLLARQAEFPAEKHLLVVPASLVQNWVAEVARFAPSLRVAVVHPSGDGVTAEVIEKGQIVLTTYGMLLRAPWLAERPWGLVVIDEAQAIKNAGTRQTQAVKALQARARVAMTGTPVENRLGDLWSLFDFLCPGLLGSARSFTRLTGAMEKSGGYGPLRRLVQPYLLRRKKTDRSVISDLPDKTEISTRCLLTRTQAALYEREVEELAGQLAEARVGIARKGLVLASMLRLKQICNHPSQRTGDGAFDPADSGKMTRVAELCDEIAQRQERVLIFTQFREMTGPLASFLAGVFGRPGLVLHGGVPVKKRRDLVESFQAEDGPPFFVISLKAGGTGLNLTAASHVIHFDRWWNPAVEDQATDRAYRIGQKRNVLVHKLVCQGTLEVKIEAMINDKRGLSAGLIEGGGEALLTELPDDKLLDLVRLDLAAALGDR